MDAASQIKVWDPFVRVFHWTVVAAFTVAFLTEDDLQTLHVWAGYTVAGLVAIRVLWGFVGTRHARFSDFVARPAAVLRYGMQTLALRARRYIGHNPIGGAMVILLLLSLLATAFTGMATYGAEEHAGPLAGWFSGSSERWGEAFEEIHEFFANFTLVLVFVHVAGVVTESLIHRENLVKAMVTGRKRA